MDAAKFVDVAVDYSSNWMDVWMLYMFVAVSWMAAVVALKESLYDHGVPLLLVFVIFLISHWVTIDRYYDVFHLLSSAVPPRDPSGLGQLMAALQPVHYALMFCVYWGSSVVILVAGIYRWYWAMKKVQAR